MSISRGFGHAARPRAPSRSARRSSFPRAESTATTRWPSSRLRTMRSRRALEARGVGDGRAAELHHHRAVGGGHAPGPGYGPGPRRPRRAAAAPAARSRPPRPDAAGRMADRPSPPRAPARAAGRAPPTVRSIFTGGFTLASGSGRSLHRVILPADPTPDLHRPRGPALDGLSVVVTAPHGAARPPARRPPRPRGGRRRRARARGRRPRRAGARRARAATSPRPPPPRATTRSC